MTKTLDVKRLSTSIEDGDRPNLFYFVAKIDGQEVAKVRVPLHVLKMEKEQQEFFLRKIASEVAKRMTA